MKKTQGRDISLEKLVDSEMSYLRTDIPDFLVVVELIHLCSVWVKLVGQGCLFSGGGVCLLLNSEKRYQGPER